MKPRFHRSPSRYSRTIMISCAMCFSVSQVHAADLYWDINGSAANSGTTAGGSWNGTTANWNSDSTGGAGGSTTAVTTASDNLFFSSGTGLTGSFTVNLSGTRSANSLFFQEGTVTLSTSSGNATLQLGADAEINVASGRTVTISGSSSGGTAPAFTTVTGVLLTGSNGYTKTGAGNLVLGNTYYPGLAGTITIKAGAVAAGSASSNFGTTNGLPVSLGDSTGSAPATFSVNRNQNYNSTVTVNAGSTGVKRLSGGPGLSANQQPSITSAITLNDDVTLGNGTAAIYSGNNYGGVRLSGTITGSKTITANGTNAFTTPESYTTNIGSGTAAVTTAKIAANNSATFTGNVSVERGALNIENAGSIGSGTAVVTTSSGGVLNLNGQSPSIAGLNDGGTAGGSVANLGSAIAAATSTSILSLVGAGNYSYSGVVQDGTYSGSSEWKVGITANLTSGGSQILSGANNYTGPTTVNGGTLYLGTSTTGSTAVTVADGAAFGVILESAGDDMPVTSLTTGTTTGAKVIINNGTFSNPPLAPIAVAGAFDVNAPTEISLLGSGLTIGANIPLISHGTLGGALGFSGLSLKLPPRTNGSLSLNTGVSPNVIEASITSTDTIRWSGGTNQDWDADTVGDGSTGTLNWKTVSASTPTRYLQGAGGTDAASFDDLADGTGSVSVNLTTTLTPTALSVNNVTRDYLFTGGGLITGPIQLHKDGAAALTIANTAPNTYTGGTLIDAGKLILGDGATSGAGVVAGDIENYGELVLNRPDDHSFANVLTGTGKLTKSQSNIVTLPSSLSMTGELAVNGGTLKFSNGANLSGDITGTGALEVSGGTLTLSGATPNSRTGSTTVSGTSIIKLQKDSNVTALDGDLYLTGSVNGSLVVVNNEQISDSATIHVLGTAADPLSGTTGQETIGALVLNTTNGTTGQFVLRNNFNILGTATVASGILGVSSGASASLGGVNITGSNTILRVSANTGATTMNIGSGGVTAAGGDWQVKFNTNNQDGVVNLGGDVSTTGNFTISNGGYTGTSLNVINLSGTRTFNIGAGTTTTVAPDFGDTGSLVKAGTGKLVLNASCQLGHGGTTSVNNGVLILNGTAPNSAPAVAAGATLGGTGSITANFTLASGATLSPGDGSSGTFAFGADATLDAGSTYAVGISGTSTCDKLSVAGTLTANGSIIVTLNGHTPAANESFDIADAATISGTPTFDFSAAALPSGLVWDTSQFATTGVITAKSLGYDAFAAVIPNAADRDPLDDPDGDGISNLMEYVFGGSPITSSQSILPTFNGGGTDLVLTFNRSDDSENDTTQVVEVGTDPANLSTVIPINPAGTLPSGVSVNIVENGSAADTVTVTISKNGDLRKFARVKASK